MEGVEIPEGRPGDVVVDLTEVHETRDGKNTVYCQLKHSIKQLDSETTLSDFSHTFERFAELYRSHLDPQGGLPPGEQLEFHIVTNRPFASSFKDNLEKMSFGEPVPVRFASTLEKHTKLQGQNLQNFCALVRLNDQEADVHEQFLLLQSELNELTSTPIEENVLFGLTYWISKMVLPGEKKTITRADILKKLGCSSEGDLLPAPNMMDREGEFYPREQQQEILQDILSSNVPFVIHAESGIGKSVFLTQLSDALPEGSVSILYDCFGNATYLNASSPRHHYKNVALQISNELAFQGWCPPLLPGEGDRDAWLRKLVERLKTTAMQVRCEHPDAVVAVFVDAADNAVVAAQEYNEDCFVHGFVKETLPEGVRLVLSCRTERLDLLKLRSSAKRIRLHGFSREQSRLHLQHHFPGATPEEVDEFHHRSNQNPRVQDYVLARHAHGLQAVLSSLGLGGTTVEHQLEEQLKASLDRLEESHPARETYNAICTGLSLLPPVIPLNVLAEVSGVPEAAIKSFVEGFGRQLHLSGNAVHFRDEPTETWFRNTFGQQESLVPYLERLKRHTHLPYVSRALPALLHRAGKYDELIEMTLNQQHLPDDPLERSIEEGRFHFALRAALKEKQVVHAIQIALMAGEVAASRTREMELYRENFDLVPPGLMEDLAFQREVAGGWRGSSLLYSAAMLVHASADDVRWHAPDFLRRAEDFLRILEEDEYPLLSRMDFEAFAYAHLMCAGPQASVKFMRRWKMAFLIARDVSRRLIDQCQWDLLDHMAQEARNQPDILLGIQLELSLVGRHIQEDLVRETLQVLTAEPTEIPQGEWNGRPHEALFLRSLVSLAETHLHIEEDVTVVQSFLNQYFPEFAPQIIPGGHYQNQLDAFLRVTALRAVMEGKAAKPVNQYLPSVKADPRFDQKQADTVAQAISKLLPWYMVRAQAVLMKTPNLAAAFEAAEQSPKAAPNWSTWLDGQAVSWVIAQLRFESMVVSLVNPTLQLGDLQNMLDPTHLSLEDLIEATRMAYRHPVLKPLGFHLEQRAKKILAQFPVDQTTSLVRYYTALARAVLASDREDAHAYMAAAVAHTSKLGSEVSERWGAVVALAEKALHSSPLRNAAHMAHRFMQCAELVGDHHQRDKYWERSRAVQVGVKIHANVAMAAVSRWRERRKGTFSSLLRTLAIALVDSRVLPAETLWGLSGFTEAWNAAHYNEKDRLADFAATCISTTSNQQHKQSILNETVHDLRVQEDHRGWDLLQKTAADWHLDGHEIEHFLAFQELRRQESQPAVPGPKRKPTRTGAPSQDPSQATQWDQVFRAVDLKTTEGLETAKARFDALAGRWDGSDGFWQKLMGQLQPSDVLFFLRALMSCREVDVWDFRTILQTIPVEHLSKASVQRAWPELILQAATKFAGEICATDDREVFMEALQKVSDFVPAVNPLSIGEQVMVALAASTDGWSARGLFGLCQMLVQHVNSAQAQELLDFALERFEKQYPEITHLTCDYPQDPLAAFAGFLWAALGAPEAETRWQAAHAVRRLAAIGDQDVLSQLMLWLDRRDAGLFSPPEFPFYHWHARLYLLLALSRVVLDQPLLLLPHAERFSTLALQGEPHVLIQEHAKCIALALETAQAGTYSETTLAAFRQVNKSPFPNQAPAATRNVQKQQPHVEQRLWFNMDVKSYWFTTLEKVFGVNGQHVAQRAEKLIVGHWGVSEDLWNNDPRQWLWSHRDETHHSHGQYPKTDALDFYLSYHSMMVIAGELLREKPVLINEHWEVVDRWTEWLTEFNLTRQDGKWLSDRRDPVPLELPPRDNLLVHLQALASCTPKEVFEQLLVQREGEVWLPVLGSWSTFVQDTGVDWMVQTALVARDQAQSLLAALESTPRYDFFLPLEGEEMRPKNLFGLKGWLLRPHKDKSFDEHDPLGGHISYPPAEVGKKTMEDFALLREWESRIWTRPGNAVSVFLQDIWSTASKAEGNELHLQGSRLLSSKGFLQELCSSRGIAVLFEVHLTFKSSYGTKDLPEERTVYAFYDVPVDIVGMDFLLTEVTHQKRG